jgi:hypothetical protein
MEHKLNLLIRRPGAVARPGKEVSMFYAVGSLLFVLALVAALGVLAGQFTAYRGKMIAALRSLSLDAAGSRTEARPEPRRPAPVLSYRPAAASVRPARMAPARLRLA